MSLFDNPIFLTQRRLAHRSGVLAAVLIAGLVGLSLLTGLIAYLANVNTFQFETLDEAAKVFYGWVAGIEAAILILGGSLHVAHALGEDRKAGLWESNRLTPLGSWQLITGYWFGSALRECYMSAVLALSGLLVVVLGKLPMTLWLGSQILILTTACFLGLLCFLMSLAFERQQGLLALVALFLLIPFSFVTPSRMIANFLFPAYAVVYLFHIDDNSWNVLPQIFNVSIHPVLLAVAVQFLVGIFLWRAAVRKTEHPVKPLVSPWEAIALFTILVILQHGLIWNIWHGRYPQISQTIDRLGEDVPVLPVVHGVAILLAIIIVALASPLPEAVRVESLRRQLESPRQLLGRSAVWLALALAIVSSAGIYTQFMFSGTGTWPMVAAVTINVACIFLGFALLLEFCRLRHKRRAPGFIILWLFILWVLPFILAGVFFSKTLARVSFLSPAFFAMLDSNPDWHLLFLIELGHLGALAVLFGAWWWQWKKLLAKTPS